MEKRAIAATGPNVSSFTIAASRGTPVITVGRVEEPAEALAAGDQLAAALERVGDVTLDLLDRRLLDQRADLRRRVEAAADGEPGRGVRESLHELVVDRVLDVDPVGRDAGLAGVAVLAEQRAGDRRVEVGVVEDDERSVAAELERDLLHAGGALGHQQLPDLGRAGEAELADERARR